MTTTSGRTAAWIDIIRLGLVQTALGAIVVLTTSTMNRVMVVELAFPAMLPGALIAWHYAIQMLRPRWGYGADIGGGRTAWIIGGMAVLAVGAVLAALATALMADSGTGGIALATVAFALIGIGVGACGTNLLALLAAHVSAERRAPAASIVWMMMILGIAVTAGVAGANLDPFSLTRLVVVTVVVCLAATTLTIVAVWGIERRSQGARAPDPDAAAADADRPGSTRQFLAALAGVWRDRDARMFTVFVFLSMLAYSAQDLILEPFAGLVFGMTPGQSTQLSGTQHGGVLAGMILVAVLGHWGKGRWFGTLKLWTVTGCVASGLSLIALSLGGVMAPGAFPLSATVFCLGFSNGVFAVAAIGSMMALAGRGEHRREGTRLGVWGAAQAIAFGLGNFAGTAAVDATRAVIPAPEVAYGLVFAGEGVMFFIAALVALRLGTAARAAMADTHHTRPAPGGVATPA